MWPAWVPPCLYRADVASRRFCIVCINQPCGGPRASLLASIRECDGHHEMSDFGADGEPVHSGGESVAPAWPHQQLDGPRWLLETWVMRTNANREDREFRELSVQDVIKPNQQS
jgi:hypothetical protein